MHPAPPPLSVYWFNNINAFYFPGAHGKYVDVLANNSSTKASPATPSSLFNVLPKSASMPANIFVPAALGEKSLRSMANTLCPFNISHSKMDVGGGTSGVTRCINTSVKMRYSGGGVSTNGPLNLWQMSVLIILQTSCIMLCMVNKVLLMYLH